MTFSSKGFAGGLNKTAAPYLLGDDEAQDLMNVDVRYGTLRKRPGFSRLNRTAMAGVGLGVFQYDTKAGTYTSILKGVGTWYSVHKSTGALTSLKTGATNTTRPARGITFRNFFYAADYDEVWTYDVGGAKWGPLTHAAPTAPTVVAGTGSLPNGAYKYVTVPYSSFLLQEGPSSATTTYTVTGTTAPNVTPTYTADDLWNQVRVYRTAVGGSSFLFHSTRSTPFAAFDDTVADSALGVAIASTTRVQIADASDVAFRNDRLWLIRKSDSSVYYSMAGKPNEFESASTIDALANDEIPVALAMLTNALVVLRRNSLALIYGDRAANYSLANFIFGAGCVSRASVQVYQDRVYFLGDGKVYEFDGANPPADISSDKIRPILRDDIGATFSRWDQAVGGINYETGEYLLSYTRSGQSINERVLRFNTKTRAWFLDDDRVSAFGRLRNASDQFVLFHACDKGFVNEREKTHFSTGITDGTLSGTATSGTTTVITDTAAAFSTTGDDLVGAFVEVTHADGTRETGRVSSNTATAITVATAFGTAIASGTTYVVCPMRAWWESKRAGTGTGGRFKQVQAMFEEQSHLEKLDVFSQVDDNAERRIAQLSMNGEVWDEAWVGEYGRRCSLKLEMGGQDKAVEVAGFSMEIEEQEA